MLKSNVRRGNAMLLQGEARPGQPLSELTGYISYLVCNSLAPINVTKTGLRKLGYNEVPRTLEVSVEYTIIKRQR